MKIKLGIDEFTCDYIEDGVNYKPTFRKDVYSSGYIMIWFDGSYNNGIKVTQSEVYRILKGGVTNIKII